MSNIVLRDYQESAVNQVRVEFRAKNDPVLFVLPTGGGKCLGKGTPVLMFDGTIRLVEDIQAGDLLMGPDSNPRRVISLARGREMLYRVTPTKGDAYVVNESHILSLKRTATSSNPQYPSQVGGRIVNISVLDYLASGRHFKHTHKGWRAAVDFPEHAGASLLEPYFLGLWLGDGTSTLPEITTGDEEIVEYVEEFAVRIGMTTSTRHNTHNSLVIKIIGHTNAGRGGTPIMNELRALDLIGNKHIPQRFKNASRQARLELLAGIIDTDGCYTGKGYDICLGNERLMDDLIFVARSLGFSAYKSPSRKTCHNNGVTGDYWRCCISGDVDRIPCRLPRKKAAPRAQKKNVLVTGITVEPIGEGDYYGFEIDGDHLFMLGDFTVTHNTFTFSYIAANAADKAPPSSPMEYIVIVVHRKELLLQASGALRALDIDHGLISPHFSPSPHKRIQVASIDTLLLRIKKRPMKVRLLIFDEAHHVVSDNKWGRLYEELGKPATLGVTATPVRSDGKGLGEHAGGIFRAMVLGPSIAELIERGNLINPIVYTTLEAPDLTGINKTKDGDYNTRQLAERVDKPKITGSALEMYQKVCPGARTIVFCVSIEHARHVVAEFNKAGFRFAILVGEPAMSDAERTAVNKALRNGQLDGACTVDLVSEGYDLPDLECCIMLRPTASESLFIQQVGRVMRPSEGKKHCWLLDHVGNVGSMVDGEFRAKHGLPDMLREWTLDGRQKKKGRKKQEIETADPLAQCPKCSLVHTPAPQCPRCGFVYPARPARQLSQVDGELVKVTAEMAARMKAEKRKEVGRAQSYEELLKIEAERGYKKGWAKHTWEAKQRRRAPSMPPPPPSNDQLMKMDLPQLEQVAREQGWPSGWASKFFLEGLQRRAAE